MEKKFQTIIVTKEEASRVEKWLTCYTDNYYRKDYKSGSETTEFHLVADEATMKRIAREVF